MSQEGAPQSNEEIIRDKVIEDLENGSQEEADLAFYLADVKRVSSALKELEYEFNLSNIRWNYFKDMESDNILKVTESVKMLLQAAAGEDREALKAAASEIAKLINV